MMVFLGEAETPQLQPLTFMLLWLCPVFVHRLLSYLLALSFLPLLSLHFFYLSLFCTSLLDTPS